MTTADAPRFDFAAIEAAIEAADEKLAANVLIEMALHADLTPTQEDRLIKLASDRADITRSAIKKELKQRRDNLGPAPGNQGNGGAPADTPDTIRKEFKKFQIISSSARREKRWSSHPSTTKFCIAFIFTG